MTRRMMIILFAAALTGCATAPAGLTGSVNDLKRFVREDLVRGREIAAAHQDQAAVECADAILAKLPESASAALMPNGLFSTFIAARELRRSAGAGVDETVHNKCAVLIFDAQETMAKLGLIAVPGGGALGGLLR